ncbi:MAG: formyl transferase [Methyloprofundus sp.]|nr:formyl transferase [Methyloprofundus sp.]
MKVLVIGAVDFSLHCLQTLHQAGADIVGVVTTSEPQRYSDYADLQPLSNHQAWCFTRVKDINAEETLDWIKQRQPDVIFCVGWSQLIKRPLLDVAPYGVIGAHPSLLPYNRGRHPLIWALALGLKQTGLSFFQMDEGADSGDILAQAPIEIESEDDAQSLYAKVKASAVPLLNELVQQLKTGTLQGKPQDVMQGNHWRKRSKKDGQIDWRMSSEAIVNLVRALTQPYPGATTVYQGQEVLIWQAQALDWPKGSVMGEEPGKILAFDQGQPIIKSYDGAVKLVEFEPKLNFIPQTYMD